MALIVLALFSSSSIPALCDNLLFQGTKCEVRSLFYDPVGIEAAYGIKWEDEFEQVHNNHTLSSLNLVSVCPFLSCRFISAVTKLLFICFQGSRVSRVVLRANAKTELNLWLGGDDGEKYKARLDRFMGTNSSQVGGSMVFDFKFLGNSDLPLQSFFSQEIMLILPWAGEAGIKVEEICRVRPVKQTVSEKL